MAAMLSSSRLVPALGAGELKTSAVGWLLFLTAAFCYCSLYEVAVLTTTPDYGAILLDVLQDWGIWLFATPLVFFLLRRHAAGCPSLVTRLGVGTLLLLAVTAVPVTIDLWLQRLPLGASVALHLPRYLAVLAVTCVVWRVHLCPRAEAADLIQARRHDQSHGLDLDRVQDQSGPAESPTELQRETPPVQTPKTYPQTLLVSKGADECLIQVERIESLSAAGNYVEITANEQRYLMRATMKQLEELLPPADFVRIHRSHIVRGERIERIKRLPSGHGTVYLRGGRALNLSKKYKSELQRFRPTLH